jgi:hypothetical protein
LANASSALGVEQAAVTLLIALFTGFYALVANGGTDATHDLERPWQLIAAALLRFYAALNLVGASSVDQRSLRKASFVFVVMTVRAPIVGG